MSTPSTAPPLAKETDAPSDRRETYMNFLSLMVRTFHLWNQPVPEANFDSKTFLLIFRFAARDELGSKKELPDPQLEEIERTIERLRSPKTLNWITGKAAKLMYDRTLMRAIVRTLSTGGSKEQKVYFRSISSRLATNLRVRRAIYHLAVGSGSMEFVEYAYGKKWLMDPLTYALLKLRCGNSNHESDSDLATT